MRERVLADTDERTKGDGRAHPSQALGHNRHGRQQWRSRIGPGAPRFENSDYPCSEGEQVPVAAAAGVVKPDALGSVRGEGQP